MSKLLSLYNDMYGRSSKINEAREQLEKIIQTYKNARSKDLINLDQHQDWYFKSDLIGMTLYIDLFGKDFKGLAEKISYFKELGITLIHLMPLLKARDGENDGGYAVEDYQDVNPQFGTLSDFVEIINIFRENHIFLCVDYVINHVAKEHQWAKAALSGNKDMQDMFIMYDSDEIPNQFNQTVPEVLPVKSPGNFTYFSEIKKYVFTSFSEFQWDLNFKNPFVFNGMVENMLYLANLGINMIRLDAIPFMWKELDTSCRNLPNIHLLLEMLNLIKTEVCPSVALLGEAIVEPHEIVKYFGSEQHIECEIMYNANLMVDIFNSFATRDARLISLDANLNKIPNSGTWMNYVRCHDDIGWGFNEQAIENMGFNPFMHKQFLIHFYGGDFPNSFSSGEDYQYNSITRDARTNGTLASLLGLEKALHSNDNQAVQTAIKRINLAHSIILFYRGFPLIYSGDEIATLNDHSFKDNLTKKNEGRWLHRPFFDWDRAKRRHIAGTHEYHVYQTLKKLIEIRKVNQFFDGRSIQYSLQSNDNSVLCLARVYQNETYFGLFNFSENQKVFNLNQIKGSISSRIYEDIINEKQYDFNSQDISLSPYEYIWIKPIVNK
ncbi:MAG: alpha-amylase [Tenericutes bacterium HGW-Tenericutes-2]|nr:MAG: alpha-amylase [Tenericutes bacterium HGW-Tenericutes-2]